MIDRLPTKAKCVVERETVSLRQLQDACMYITSRTSSPGRQARKRSTGHDTRMYMDHRSWIVIVGSGWMTALTGDFRPCRNRMTSRANVRASRRTRIRPLLGITSSALHRNKAGASLRWLSAVHFNGPFDVFTEEQALTQQALGLRPHHARKSRVCPVTWMI
ncbi:hypothetical protein VTN02DRAFT_5025 [Thermoascus thermophilus]